MIDAIITFFNKIGSIIASLWGLIWSAIEQLIQFFILLYQGIMFLGAFLIDIPVQIRLVASIGLTVSVLYLVLGRSKGGD